MLMDSGSPEKPSSNSFNKETFEDYEPRLGRVETDIRYLKSLPHNVNTAAIPTPKFANGEHRLNSLKALGAPSGLSSPAKKRRFSNKSVLPTSPLVASNGGTTSSSGLPLVLAGKR